MRLTSGFRRIAALHDLPPLQAITSDAVSGQLHRQNPSRSATYNTKNKILTRIGATLMDGPAFLRKFIMQGFIMESAGLVKALRDDAALEAYIRRAAVGVWHCSCSCRMGSGDDPMAVTDEQGRVRGVHGLRVVDASIFPVVPCANTNFPTMMVAEKIADDHAAGSAACCLTDKPVRTTVEVTGHISGGNNEADFGDRHSWLALCAGQAAAQKADVMHWWTSGGESRAVAVFAKEYDKRGGTWVDDASVGPQAEHAAAMNRIAGGNPPTAMQWNIGVAVRQLAEQGVLTPLDEQAKKGNWLANLPPLLVKNMTYDGHVIAVPVNIHGANYQFYSVKVFDELKMQPPKSWDEFLADAPKIKAAGFIPHRVWHDGPTAGLVVLFDSRGRRRQG